MKMPATTNVKVEAKPSAEMGDAAKQCLNCLEKKVRNLEKRKGKIEINKEKAEKGTKLEKEQEISLKQYDQVTHDLEFARELHKQFQTINLEHEKMVKKQAKREKVERQANEIKRVCEILQLQSTLDLMGGDQVREDFKTGKHGAVVLTEDNLDQLDQLYQAISPSRDDSGDQYPQKLNTAAEHLVNIVDGKDRQVMGTTYKELKELLVLINGCGYFENAKQSTPEKEVEVEEEDGSREAEAEEPAVAEPLVDDASPVDEPEESSPEPSQQQQQQPIDLTTNATEGVKSHLDMSTQPLNTLEQDAFFAPSSAPAFPSEASPAASGGPFSQHSGQDFQSFTHNRPIQFIQASYLVPEAQQQQQQAPSVVDPAVIHAQPAVTGSGGPSNTLAFVQPSPVAFGDSSVASSVQSSSQQSSQSQPPSQPVSGLGMGELANSSTNVSVAEPQQAPPQDFAAPTQTFGQPASLQQNLQSDGLFSSEDVGIMGQMRGTEESGNSFDNIPPSIPMPPSQQGQDQSALEQQQQHHHQQQQLEEKKFQMNASAPVFQSMYAQQVGTGAVSVTMPPPTVSADSPPSASDFPAQSSDTSAFQQGYQGNNGFNSSMYNRGRGGYRGGSRNGASGGGPMGAGVRNGSGAGTVQNGFGTNRPGGPMGGNSRGGGRGAYNNYNPNQQYRQDNYQSAYNPGSFNSYQKRGMNPSGGPPNMGSSGYTRGGSGGMRGGGMPRGGQRGGNMRGGFNRPPPSQ